MRSAFESSVPARKPKTQIGRVLTVLTTNSPRTDPVDNGTTMEENGTRSEPLAAISLRDAPAPPRASTEPVLVRETSTTAESTRVSSECQRLIEPARSSAVTAASNRHRASLLSSFTLRSQYIDCPHRMN